MDRPERPRAVDLPLPPGSAIVVCGAANWQVQDRYLDWDTIAPLQVVLPEGVLQCRWFDRYRDVGISCLIPHPDGGSVVFTTGADLVRLRLDDGECEPLEIPELCDVHELTPTDTGVLVANTGRDEVIEVDLDAGMVRERRQLAPLRRRGRPARALGGEGIESFHLNQAFSDGDRLMGLVHHIEGFRLFSHAHRRLTGHGSGGLLDLRTGWRKDLRLHAPHTVRRRDKGWLLLNSGRKEMLLVTPEWECEGVIPTMGWGRGGALTKDGRFFFAGISGIRRRYARPGDSRWTGIEALDMASGDRWSLQLPRIEQVNAVELCGRELAEALVALPTSSLSVDRVMDKAQR